MQVDDFIQTFRERIGDSSRSVPASYIMSYLNTALRRLARTEGVEKLFERRDTFDLAAINKDGTPSAAWDLGKIGKIIDIPRLRILKAAASQICELKPKYMETDNFYDQCPIPEQKTPGDPQYYTMEQIGTKINRLLFNRPPCDLVSLDIWYSAFHPRITSIEDEILIAYEYCDILEEYVIILHKIETTDQSTARALWEDLDVIVADLVEVLAKRKKGLPYRRIRRSF